MLLVDSGPRLLELANDSRILKLRRMASALSIGEIAAGIGEDSFGTG